MTDNQTTQQVRRKDHDVATSSAMRPGVGFARSVSAEERAWVETHILGTEFLRAAQRFGSNPHEYAGAPVYFLYIHAVELALKSFLLRAGCTEEKLKKLSHNLLKIFEEAKVKGLNASDPDTDNIVSRLSNAVKKAAIRYEFPHSMPLVGDVEDVATALIQDTQPPTPMPGDVLND